MTVAAGTITSPGGAAMPGVKVDLYAWPTDAVLSAMQPGQAVPTTLLATATTSNAGGYTLRVPAARLRAAAVESGYANLEIFSPVGMWFLPYQTGSLPARPSAPVTVSLVTSKSASCGSYPDGMPYVFTGFSLQRKRGLMRGRWFGQGYIIRQKRTAGDFVSFKYTRTFIACASTGGARRRSGMPPCTSACG